MKHFPAILLVLGALFADQVTAQARRENPAAGSPATKRNRRDARPEPTPPTTTGTESDADDAEVIKVETDLVTIPIRVLDRRGRFVAGLRKENFRVYDEGVEQRITHFSSEKEPFTVALVLDMSYSSKFKVAEIQSAAVSFIDQLGPEDKVTVVSFDQEVHVLCRPTTDRNTIYKAIMSTRIETGTSLYDAVDIVVNDVLRGVDGRKAVILFTDGVDTTSSDSSGIKNLKDALELDALIYPIGYDTFADVQRMKNNPVLVSQPPATTHRIPGKRTIALPIPVPTIGTAGGRGTTEEDYRTAREYLEQLALRTGGTLIPADSVGRLNAAFAKIAGELREYYSVGFYPADNLSPTVIRRLRVKVDRQGAAVKARESYSRRRSPPAATNNSRR